MIVCNKTKKSKPIHSHYLNSFSTFRASYKTRKWRIICWQFWTNINL